jgi:hypothetical protein
MTVTSWLRPARSISTLPCGTLSLLSVCLRRASPSSLQTDSWPIPLRRRSTGGLTLPHPMTAITKLLVQHHGGIYANQHPCRAVATLTPSPARRSHYSACRFASQFTGRRLRLHHQPVPRADGFPFIGPFSDTFRHRSRTLWLDHLDGESPIELAGQQAPRVLLQ